MWAMDIQAESGIFSQGQTDGKKMFGLVLTEIDRNLWAVFVQEQSLVRAACKERLRWSKETADNRRWRHIRCTAGSAWAELIHTIATAWWAACWGQPEAGRCKAVCQKLTDRSTDNRSSGYVMMQLYKTDFCSEKCKRVSTIFLR